VAYFVQQYFDLVAVFKEDEFFISSSQEDENQELSRHIDGRSGRTLTLGVRFLFGALELRSL